MPSLTENRAAKAGKLLRQIDIAARRLGVFETPDVQLRAARLLTKEQWDNIAVLAAVPPPDTSIGVVYALLARRAEAVLRVKLPAAEWLELYAEQQYSGQAKADGFLVGLVGRAA